MNKTVSKTQRAEYDAIMAERKTGQRSALVGHADPFGETSLSDFIGECELLEAMAGAWKMKFCQATHGYGRKSGGLWFAYREDMKPAAVVHAEVFTGDFPSDSVGFWADQLLNLYHMSLYYKIKVGVAARFDNGTYYADLGGRDPQSMQHHIGERLQKGDSYAGTFNMITTLPVDFFKKIAGKSAETR